jgi:hypothetical protein
MYTGNGRAVNYGLQRGTFEPTELQYRKILAVFSGADLLFCISHCCLDRKLIRGRSEQSSNTKYSTTPIDFICLMVALQILKPF